MFDVSGGDLRDTESETYDQYETTSRCIILLLYSFHFFSTTNNKNEKG